MSARRQPHDTVMVVGLALLLFAFMEVVDWGTADPIPSGDRGSSRASSPPPVEIRLSAAVSINTPVPTATGTPRASPTPTPGPTRDAIGMCGTATPGTLCHRTGPTPAPPTPYADCARVAGTPVGYGSDLCQWRSD